MIDDQKYRTLDKVDRAELAVSWLTALTISEPFIAFVDLTESFFVPQDNWPAGPLCCSPRFGSVFTAPLPLQSENLRLTLNSKLKAKPSDEEQLKFGQVFTDHMLTVHWRQSEGWGSPRILPFQNLSLHPACKVFHYAQELYEGMKAYRGVDDRIRLFRPDLNMRRMNMTAERSCLPTFDPEELLECIKR